MKEHKKKEELLIIFVKNTVTGKVKTRLAQTIGDEDALYIYNRLLDITEQATALVAVSKRIAFSESEMDSRWPLDEKTVQRGKNLGERMKNAFHFGFADGYKKIVLIGSDLPGISSEIIEEAFEKLAKSDTVFGPAQDGGYYLVGLKNTHDFIFENKPWSQPYLLDITLAEVALEGLKTSLLEVLNDIDTFEDLESSDLYNEYLNRHKVFPND